MQYIEPIPSSRTVTACPACGGTRLRPRSAEVCGFIEYAGALPFQQPPYSVLECGNCALAFKSHTIPLEKLGPFYAALEHTKFESDSLFPTDRVVVRELSAMRAGSRVLDFGCSTGRILSRVADHLSCHGVEVNATSASVARSRGIRLWSEKDVFAGVAGSFDRIVLTDVYEHLPEPLELLERLVGILERGGSLILSTGDADALVPQCRLAESWYFRAIGHLHAATGRHIEWLADRLGLVPRWTHHCSHYDAGLCLKAFERFRMWAYLTCNGDSIWALAIRRTPGLCRAAKWPMAPLLCTATDHIVVSMRKTQ